MDKQKVLFLCTGNSARSQMAEGLLRKYGGSAFEVYSAGLEPKGIHPCTVQVMEEIGVDMSGHSSKPLSRYIGQLNFDYLITVCSQADEKCPYYPGLGARLHWPFEDPAAFQGSPEETQARFRQVRDQIQARILAWMKEKGIALDA